MNSTHTTLNGNRSFMPSITRREGLLVIGALFLTAGRAWAGETGRQAECKVTAPTEPGRLDLVIDTDRTTGTCYRFWTVSVFTSQEGFADKDCSTWLKNTRPFMKEASCVRLLGGRTDHKNMWYKGVDAKGNVKTDFTGLVSYMKGLVGNGYTPLLNRGASRKQCPIS